MRWFILAWLICGIISYIYGSIKYGVDCGSPFFLMYVIMCGPIGLLIQITEKIRERK